MSVEHYIAGDWGTSNLRVYLFEYNTASAASSTLEIKSGLGIAAIANDSSHDFETEFFSIIDEWLACYDIQEIILSGMVGSNIGWHSAHYSECPATASKISEQLTTFQARQQIIHIVSGLSCVNPLGRFDVMRGEELQLLGWMLRHGDDATRLFALPGTHNKWALVCNGEIQSFATAFSGELFKLLSEHSVLVAKREHVQDQAQNKAKLRARFDQAASFSFDSRKPDLIQTLFSTRALQLSGELDSHEAIDYLSGLIIGADVQSALRVFNEALEQTKELISEIVLIGEPDLCERYARVLTSHSHLVHRICAPQDVATEGYQAIYQELRNTQDVRERLLSVKARAIMRALSQNSSHVQSTQRLNVGEAL